jgi:transposase-like protein
MLAFLTFGHINPVGSNTIFIDITTAVNSEDTHLNIRVTFREICRRAEEKLHAFFRLGTISKRLFSCTQCRFTWQRTTGNEFGRAWPERRDKMFLLLYGIDCLS